MLAYNIYFGLDSSNSAVRFNCSKIMLLFNVHVFCHIGS